MRIAARNRTLAASDNQFLNKLNEKIQKMQNESGRAFVSRTTIENVYEGCPVTALRAVLGNPFTTEADIDFILEDQIRIADRVLQESGIGTEGFPRTGPTASDRARHSLFSVNAWYVRLRMARRNFPALELGTWIIKIPISFSRGSIQKVGPQAPVQ